MLIKRFLLIAMGCAASVSLARPSLAQSGAKADPSQVHEHVDVHGVLLTPTREGSGTAWVPAETPMYGVHQPWRGWDLRLTASVLGQFVYEPTDRHRTGGADRSQWSSVNWGMATLRRNAGAGRFGVRGMLSADAWTTSGCGALDLFATGEVCQADTIHDRQQPHDFVMELAADYEHPLAGNWRWQAYAGIAGEPALGPPGYSHRTSAGANPTAPVSHHLIDPPTSFGVLTGGIHNGIWKVEASAFNGRSADDSRSDIDFDALDSASARVSWLPTGRIALQVSAGRIHEATSELFGQQLDPATKIVASISYHHPFGEERIWASTIAYGVARSEEFIAGTVYDILSDGVLIESSFAGGAHEFFGRAEIVALPAHHLHAHEFLDSVFTTSKVQVGYVRRFSSWRGWTAGAGGSISASFVPEPLVPRYEGNVSPGFGVFINLRPARHAM